MEIIVGMLAAFLMGAIVANPGILTRVLPNNAQTAQNQAVENPVQGKELSPEEKADMDRMKQIENMWNYTGKEQPHD